MGVGAAAELREARAVGGEASECWDAVLVLGKIPAPHQLPRRSAAGS